MNALVAAGSGQPDEIGGIAGWAVDLMDKLGAPGAGLAIALENLFPPLPSEVILPLSGFTAAQGRYTLTEAILWTTLGSLVGALALYGLGAWLGRDRLYAVWRKVPLVKTEDLERTETWFAKHGHKAVFFGRMLPIFRSLISVPAGIERMRLSTFTMLTTAGSLIWNVIFVVAGYELGDNWRKVETYAGYLQKVVIVAVVLAVAWFVITRIRSMQRTRRAPDEPHA